MCDGAGRRDGDGYFWLGQDREGLSSRKVRKGGGGGGGGIPRAEIFLLTAATIQSKRRAYRFLASESLASAAAAGERRVVMRSPPMISMDLVVRAVSSRLSLTWQQSRQTH